LACSIVVTLQMSYFILRKRLVHLSMDILRTQLLPRTLHVRRRSPRRPLTLSSLNQVSGYRRLEEMTELTTGQSHSRHQLLVHCPDRNFPIPRPLPTMPLQAQLAALQQPRAATLLRPFPQRALQAMARLPVALLHHRKRCQVLLRVPTRPTPCLGCQSSPFPRASP
jgi:hypothetical protein